MNKHPVVHFEMPYEDRERLTSFYEKAFGWKMQNMGEEMGNYVLAQTAETDDEGMVKTPGTINGGFAPKTEDYKYPSVVVHVDDITVATQAVTDAGGKILGEPIEIPGIGKYVIFNDSEGNVVSMLEPKPQ
jgi:predicted enzyme related to lactoylglutathione lyase